MSSDGWSSGHDDDAHPSELEGLSDDDGGAAVDYGSSDVDDDDEGGSSLPDVFEEFHNKSSQRIHVLLQQTDDKICHTYMTGVTPMPDRDCFEQWASSSCYLRVQGHNGFDGSAPPAPSSLPTCVHPLPRASTHARNSATSLQEKPWPVAPSPFLEVRGCPIKRCSDSISALGVACNAHDDEEVLASHGILDELICKHIQVAQHFRADETSSGQSPRARSAVVGDDDAVDLVAPAPCLVDQVLDAVLERLWMTVTSQLQPLLRHVLLPLSAPHSVTGRMSLLKVPEATAAPAAPPAELATPVVTSARLQLVLPRQRNLTNQFVPVLASRDIHRGVKRVAMRPLRHKGHSTLSPLRPTVAPPAHANARQPTASAAPSTVSLPRLGGPTPRQKGSTPKYGSTNRSCAS